MMIANDKVRNRAMLADMYSDDYFPKFLVDKIKVILLELCEQIESEQPQNDGLLLKLTHAATELINGLAGEFEENDSELETVAREAMGAEFEFIVRSYGFTDVDIEDVIAPRDW
jgi:Mor family transcriptional regulator